MALAATNPAMAATAIMVGGIAEPLLPDFLMSQALGGEFTGTDEASGTPWVRQSVWWPAQAAPFLGIVSLGQSISTGTQNLIAQIADAQKNGTGPVTVVGVSAGSLVLDETLRYFQQNPSLAPDPKLVNFVVIADGSRQSSFKNSPFNTVSGYTYQTPPNTPYNVTVVGYQYDGLSDFPDRPFNLLAVANALAGALVLHIPSFFTDISGQTPTSVVTDPTTKGTTTTYLLAPKQLPLVTLLPFLAPIQDQLKAIIDAGYSRNDVSALSAAASTAAAVTAAANVSTIAATTPDKSLTGPAAIPTLDTTKLVSTSIGGQSELGGTTSAATTPAAGTPAVVTPDVVTPAAVTSDVVTSDVVTPAVVTPDVVTPAVGTATAGTDTVAATAETVAAGTPAADGVQSAPAGDTPSTAGKDDGSSPAGDANTGATAGAPSGAAAKPDSTSGRGVRHRTSEGTDKSAAADSAKDAKATKDAGTKAAKAAKEAKGDEAAKADKDADKDATQPKAAKQAKADKQAKGDKDTKQAKAE